MHQGTPTEMGTSGAQFLAPRLPNDREWATLCRACLWSSSLAHLRDNISTADVTLPEDALKELNSMAAASKTTDRTSISRERQHNLDAVCALWYGLVRSDQLGANLREGST
jgi:hypothetical protein